MDEWLFAPGAVLCDGTNVGSESSGEKRKRPNRSSEETYKAPPAGQKAEDLYGDGRTRQEFGARRNQERTSPQGENQAPMPGILGGACGGRVRVVPHQALPQALVPAAGNPFSAARGGRRSLFVPDRHGFELRRDVLFRRTDTVASESESEEEELGDAVPELVRCDHGAGGEHGGHVEQYGLEQELEEIFGDLSVGGGDGVPSARDDGASTNVERMMGHGLRRSPSPQATPVPPHRRGSAFSFYRR